MSIEELISTYGYLAVGIGSFLEGETVLILGGYSAHRGFLELPIVMLVAFVGSFCGDQLYFFMGRKKGRPFIDRRPAWQSKSVKIFQLLEKHQILLLLGFRFMYGIRTITPFVVGAAHISPQRFFILNFIGAGLWSISIGFLGYFFGHTLEVLMEDLKRYELYVFGLIVLIAMMVWITHRVGSKK